jgi:hypothetical protein
MKKVVIFLISFTLFLILISEPTNEEPNANFWLLKGFCLMYFIILTYMIKKNDRGAISKD